jgi:hypothetical protein
LEFDLNLLIKFGFLFVWTIKPQISNVCSEYFSSTEYFCNMFYFEFDQVIKLLETRRFVLVDEFIWIKKNMFNKISYEKGRFLQTGKKHLLIFKTLNIVS